MGKGPIEIREDLCKGCGLCIYACPKNVLALAPERLNAKGYHFVELIAPNGECTGCALCAVMCPDIVITVYRQATSASARRPVPSQASI